jgi:hypothetical protein
LQPHQNTLAIVSGTLLYFLISDPGNCLPLTNVSGMYSS